jgi:hypothetical protein
MTEITTTTETTGTETPADEVAAKRSKRTRADRSHELNQAAAQGDDGAQGETLSDDERAQLAEHTAQLAANSDEPAPVRATWKQHGNPTGGFVFFGTAVKAPADKGVKVGKIDTDAQGITLKSANGRAIEGGAFGSATKFWAIVPADAPRKSDVPTSTPKAGGLAKLPAEKLTAPAGYVVKWPHGGYDLLKKTDKDAAGAAWLVRCNYHGTTKEVASAKEGDGLGSNAGRPSWCAKCKAHAEQLATAGAK